MFRSFKIFTNTTKHEPNSDGNVERHRIRQALTVLAQKTAEDAREKGVQDTDEGFRQSMQAMYKLVSNYIEMEPINKAINLTAEMKHNLVTSTILFIFNELSPANVIE